MPDASQYLTRIWTSGALLVRDPAFTLKSGRQSHVYANHRNLVCLPADLRLLSEMLYEAAMRLDLSEYAVASVDSSVSPVLCAAWATSRDIPMYAYRRATTERGVAEEVFGYDRNLASSCAAGLPAVLVDDVVTTNSTLERAAAALKDAGVAVAGAVCVLDRRLPDHRGEALLQVESVSTMADALQFGLDHGHVDPSSRPAVDAELDLLRSA